MNHLNRMDDDSLSIRRCLDLILNESGLAGSDAKD